jgi:hypothetical protein
MDRSMSRPLDPPAAPAPAAGRIAAWVTIGLVAWLAQCLVYWPAFGAHPSGDDWTPPLWDIHRARQTGLLSLFTHNSWAHPMWRPLQSVAFVGLNRLPGDLFAWVSVLNHVCAIAAFAAVLLWARAARLPLAAAAAGAIAFAAHPINAAAIASVDGFGSVLTPASAWLLAWVVYRLRGRPWTALAVVVPIYVVLSGVKEYLFAFAPMACVVTLFFFPRRARSTLIVGGALAVVTGGLLAARRLLVPIRLAGDGSVNASNFGVAKTISNTAMGMGASLAPSNTISFFDGAGATRFLGLGLGVALTLALCVAGFAVLLRRQRRDTASDDADGVARPPAFWIAFFLLMTLASLFPANVSMRMSEMYLLGPGIGVGLLLALAADGLARLPSPALRAVAVAAFVAWAGWAAASTWAKSAELARSGEESWAIARYLAGHLPDSPDGSVAVLYDADQVARAGGYSVFRVPRAGLVLPETLGYLRPGHRGPLHNRAVRAGEVPADLGKYDVVVAWDFGRREGRVVSRAAAATTAPATATATAPATQD